MPHFYLWMGERMLKSEELRTKYPKVREQSCYESREAHHFISFKENIRVYSVISREK